MRKLLIGLRRCCAHSQARDERGSSLLEVMVGMTIMTIFGAIFTGSVVMMHKSANKVEAVNISATQLNQAYLTLDKLVRYADTISKPGQGSTTGGSKDWYVELRDTTSGVERCTQLRLNATSQQLQLRTWIASDPAAGTSFRSLAGSIVNGGAASGSSDQPFVLASPGAAVHYQQLLVNLSSRSGNASASTTARSSLRFTALNSTSTASSGSVCQQRGRP